MQLSNLYASGAVFQRRMPIVLQGKTDPNTKIRCSLAGKEVYGGAGLDGSFLVRFPALEAGGPYVLKIENIQTEDSYRAEDILIGEVYLASGQSNMEFTLKDSPLQLREFLGSNDDADTIRMLTVEKRALNSEEREFRGEWKKALPENISDFSAVSLWFAKTLRDELKVPVGILSSSWGGTPAEAWVSRNTISRNETMARELSVFDQSSRRESMWKWTDLTPESSALNTDIDCPEVPMEGLGLKSGWGAIDFNDADWKDFTIPSSWYAQGITGNGAVWVRKTFELPASWEGKDAVVHLGGIDKHDITYLNGVEIGRTGQHLEARYWNTLRAYRVPGKIMRTGKNVLSIRGSSFIMDGSLGGKPEEYYLENAESGEKIPLCGNSKIAVDVPRDILPYGSLTLRSLGATNPGAPTTLFNGMIAPLLPYTIRGFLWYQGENNADTMRRAEDYETLMKALVQDWRWHWAEGDLPFILTQLAAFQNPAEYEDGTWPRLRESQRRVERDLPNVGMVCALDCGDAKDIHPKDKKTVGKRMAAWALKHVYARNVPCEGPTPVRMLREESSLRILFDNCDGGIVSSDGKELRGFYVADERAGAEFHPADAIVEGNSVCLSSTKVDYPVRVRYAWSINPAGSNLANGAGFPAAAFEL